MTYKWGIFKRGHKKREPLLGSLLFGIRAFESDILSHLTFIIPNLFFEQRKIWGGKFFQAFLFKPGEEATQPFAEPFLKVVALDELKYGNIRNRRVKNTTTRSKSSSSSKKNFKTFTYFIPSPPARKNGYREKEFDKIMHGILQSGFELVDLKTQGLENGMFIIAVLGVPSKKIAQLDEFLDMQDNFKLKDSHSSPDIILEDEDA